MAYESNLQLASFEAGQTFANKQFYCVNLASDGQVDPAGDGATVLGVIQDAPTAAGRAASVAIAGLTKVAATTTGTHPAISVGSALISSTTGQAVAASTGGTAYVWGRAVIALSTENADTITALITHEGPTSTA